jgi:thiamine biosynthesis protein ThiI
MKYVIKVAPEITIKSKPVRKRTVRMLEKNIKIHLDDFDGFFSIRSFWDRIDIDFVDLPGMDAQLVDILKNIPGIYSFTEVECFDLPSDEKEVFDFILEKVANYWALKIS